MWNVLAAALYVTMLSSDPFCSVELDRLLAVYDSYGLPHPPKDAALVLFVSGQHLDLSERFDKWISCNSPALGFSRGGKTVLDELGKPFDVRTVKSTKPDPTMIGDDVPLGAIEDAIQYHARGWKSLARAAFRKWMAEQTYWTPDKHLRWYAWEHWKRRLHLDPDVPLATIAERLEQLHLHSPPGRVTDRKKLLVSLRLALKPRNSKPGSDEALIDALIEARGQELFEPSRLGGFRLDPRYRALLRRGLDAAPALIAHLDDDRLVRCYSRVCGCGEDLRVRHIVFDLLMQMNGGSMVDGWRGVLDGGLPAGWSEAISNWYADARKLGEEKHILSRVLGEDKDDDQFRPGLLWLLAEKYPHRLPEVFCASIDTRKEHFLFAWEYAKAVAGAPIPVADKRKVLAYAAMQKQSKISAAGVHYLRPFDPKLAKEQLLVGLAARADPDDTAALAATVAEGADPDEWKALGAAVRRAAVSERCGLLDTIAHGKTPEGRTRRLALLVEYLTDDETRVDEDIEARFPQIEVRNFVAMELAEVLKLDAEPDEKWTTAQWAALREKVRAKVKDELLKP